MAGLSVPVTGCPCWGDGARALVEQVGGRWPADLARRHQLCRFVWYRHDRDCWEVDDVPGFARAAGAKVLDGQAVQPPLRVVS